MTFHGWLLLIGMIGLTVAAGLAWGSVGLLIASLVCIVMAVTL